MASRASPRPSSLRSSASTSDAIDPIQEEVVSTDGHVSAPTERSPLLPHPAPAQSAKPRLARNPILVLLAIFAFAVAMSVVLKTLLGEFDDASDGDGDTGHPPGTDPRGRRHPAVLATGSKAGVATENQLCSQIGLDVLIEHGTAVDAAVASTLCVGVLNMFSSGIGGGGFMIVRDPTKCYGRDAGADCAEHVTIDFRETAPAAANKTMYVGRVPRAQFGGLAVGVPGELRGLEEAHRRWGRLPWKRLVQPSVELARSAKVSKELARRLAPAGAAWILAGQEDLHDTCAHLGSGGAVDPQHALAHPRFDIVADHGTMHLSILDAHGMAVAVTSTVNLIFGSRVMDRETGVILNDEMDDTSTPGVPNAFGLAPSPFNYPEPRKRPLSSTCPTIVESEDGEVELVLGGSGGSRIFSAVLQTLFNYVLWGMDLSQAIEAPRLHHQLLPTQLSVETGYSNKSLAGLLGRGHEVAWLDIDLGVAEVQAVAATRRGRHRKVFAASDSRKGGIAVAV
ncbi:hypothetical protein L1887_43392 [Cichorium endivia]|nr:hypothetical protein L1887_43392 [Cichorium endivia]